MKNYLAILTISLALCVGISLTQKNQTSHSSLAGFSLVMSAQADTTAPSPTPSVITQVATDASSASVSASSFVTDAVSAFKSFSSLNTWLKLALVFLLFECLLKVPYLETNLWSKWGSFESWGPAVLALLGGAAVMAGVQGSFSFGSLMGYFASGSGAALLGSVISLIVGALSPNSLLASILSSVASVLVPAPAAPATSSKRK